MRNCKWLYLTLLVFIFAACDEDENPPQGTNPDTAPKVSVDRFSMDAGMLMVRDATNGLPEANVPIDYDAPNTPFLTRGLGPDGEIVEYYNFDIQPVQPAPIYALFKDGESEPVPGQLNIIDVIPGDANYNDFWQVYKVTVPADYVANTMTSYADLVSSGYNIEMLGAVVNCPVVPEGSTATKRLDGAFNGLVRGWYKDQIAFYFDFSEKQLSVTGNDEVPLSPIYVTFNINPDEMGGGPASGFVMESGSVQTHNVVATLPSDAGYSPLWNVTVFDNADFDNVSDLASASSANIKGVGVAKVNCPVVSVQ